MFWKNRKIEAHWEFISFYKNNVDIDPVFKDHQNGFGYPILLKSVFFNILTQHRLTQHAQSSM